MPHSRSLSELVRENRSSGASAVAQVVGSSEVAASQGTAAALPSASTAPPTAGRAAFKKANEPAETKGGEAATESPDKKPDDKLKKFFSALITGS